MAIVIGIVLSYQNGWLGFGSPENLIVESNSPDNPSSNSVLGDAIADVDVFAGKGTRGSNELERIQDGGTVQIPGTPVHNVVQVRNPNAPRTNVAGVFSSGGRSITAGSESVQNIPGQRPVQNIHNVNGVQHTSSVLNTMPVLTQADHALPNTHFHSDIINAGDNFNNVVQHTFQGAEQSNSGVPLPTLINPAPEIPVPSLVPADPPPREQPSSGGTIPGNAITTPNGRIIINAPPVIPPRNPFKVFPSNLQTGEFGNTNLNFQVPSNLNHNQETNISTHPFADILLPHHNTQNFDRHTDRVNQAFPLQPIPFSGEQSGLGQSVVSQGNDAFRVDDQRFRSTNTPQQIVNDATIQNNRPIPLSFSINGQNSNSGSNLALGPQLEKKSKVTAQENQIDLEKMKMLKEILDAEGSGKLLQDLITLNNNRNSLNAISQHLSEVTGHGPNPSIHSGSPQRNIANLGTPAVLKHRDTINDSPIDNKNQDKDHFQTESAPNLPTTTARTSNGNLNFGNFNQHVSPELKPETTTPKSKSNIQMVRELLASLINSPEVQQILSSRKNQQEQTQGRAVGDQSQKSRETGRVKVKGDEMRELLLKALAKEIPSGQSLQSLRLHGPQPSQTRQISSRNRVGTKRGQKTARQRGKITRAQQLIHFNTTTPPRATDQARGGSSLTSRVISNRMGVSDSKKKLTSVEHQSVRPPSRRRNPTNPFISSRTSRGRQNPVPHFTLRVKSYGESEGSSRSRSGRKLPITEAVDMNKGAEEDNVDKRELGNGEVLRHWRHMDDDGTVSQGTVRRDGSFAFTNCRPANMCSEKKKQ